MAKLSTSARNNLPKTSFAIPGARAYPIDTPARARSALARVAANGSPAQKAQVRAAVAKKFPGMKVAGAAMAGAPRKAAARKMSGGKRK